MENSKKPYKTAAKSGIMSYIMKNQNRTLSVNDIVAGLKENEIEVNLSTVYRCLGRLETDGVITKHTDENGEMAMYQYIPSRKCDEHLHMQCRSCGKLIHLDCDFMSEFSEHILKHHGFELCCKGSILYGICSDCAAEK